MLTNSSLLTKDNSFSTRRSLPRLDINRDLSEKFIIEQESIELPPIGLKILNQEKFNESQFSDENKDDQTINQNKMEEMA